MTVRIKVGTWAQSFPVGLAHTPESLAKRDLIPRINCWLVADDGQEYFGSEVLPPGDYRMLTRNYAMDDAAHNRRSQFLRAAVCLPSELRDLVESYLPPAVHAELIAPKKFGCCCWPQFEVQQSSMYQRDQLGFPRCCVDPYGFNETSKCLFYFATRSLVFGPLLALGYAVVSLLVAAAGLCCQGASELDWAVRFVPCWIIYAVVFMAYFVYASQDAEYLQGDYDEGTGMEGCYFSVCFVGLYLGACVGVTIGLCYVV